MNKKREAITDAELALMRLLWGAESMTAREIRERLYPGGTESAHGTVQKLLQRLESKGYVARDRSNFAHLFRATISEQEYAGGQLQSLAEKLTGGSLVPFLTHLVDSKGISKRDLRKLQELFDKKKQR